MKIKTEIFSFTLCVLNFPLTFMHYPFVRSDDKLTKNSIINVFIFGCVHYLMSGIFRMFSRRKFIKGTGLVLTLSGLSSFVSWSNLTEKNSNSSSVNWFVSCGSDQSGNYYAIACTENGMSASKVMLPSRGHGVLPIANKPGHAFIFARSPQTYIVEVDFNKGSVVNQTKTKEGQHISGHGCLTPDDKYLICTENDYINNKGIIVVRDVETLKEINQYYSGGMGPHELKIMPDGKTIVVANGGIKTHPDQKGKKLNIETMKPNLTYIEAHSGKILSQHTLSDHKLQIRHLDVSQKGKVVAALQNEGKKPGTVSLVMSHYGAETPVLFEAPERIWEIMNNYAGSVEIDDVSNTVIVTSSKTNSTGFWDLTTGKFISLISTPKGSGAFHKNSKTIITVADGGILEIDTKNTRQVGRQEGVKWDNHAVPINMQLV